MAQALILILKENKAMKSQLRKPKSESNHRLGKLRRLSETQDFGIGQREKGRNFSVR